MKTDKKTMASIYRKMADNVERGIDAHSGIQFYCSIDKKWIDKGGPDTYKNILYRIKPETITLKNGVDVPKPLDHSELNGDNNHFFVSPTKYMFDYAHVDWIKDRGIRFVYKTKEEAIEASKALFGIE